MSVVQYTGAAPLQYDAVLGRSWSVREFAVVDASTMAALIASGPFADVTSLYANPVGGGGGGATTLSALTDIASYDLGSNNTYVAAIKATANAAATASALAATNSNVSANTTAIANKINVPAGWNGTTPALSTGTNPVTAGFGSNSFIVTTANSTTLDGISSWALNDIAIFGAAGTSTWSKIAAAGTLASLTDIASYDLGTNNTAVAAIKATANAAATQSALNTTNANVSANTAAMTVQTDNSQTGTTYTFVIGDAGQNVDLSNAAAITATIPPHSSVAYPVGTLLYWRQWGAGAVTIAAGAGVTLDKPTSRSYTTSAQKEGGYAYQWAQDFWSIYNS